MQLNLPQYTHNIRKKAEQLEIFCLVRKKWYVLTPEEWVRQNVTKHLLSEKGFPIAFIAFEQELDVLGKKMRPDIVVYNALWQVEGIMECKAPFVDLDQKVLDQIGRYNRLLNANWIGVSNGIKHCFQWANLSWQETWPLGNP